MSRRHGSSALLKTAVLAVLLVATAVHVAEAGGERHIIATAATAPTPAAPGASVYLGTFSFSLNKAATASDLTLFRITHYGTAGTGTITDIELWQDADTDPGNGLGTQYGATVASLSGSQAQFNDTGVITVSGATATYAHVFATVSAAATGQTVGFELSADTDRTWSQAYNDGTTYPVQLGTATVQTANTPPTVTITSPADASTFNEGDNITFTGTASDAEDGDISANLSWTSSIDGAIGSGASFSRSDLSFGTHTITASVTDSGGLSGDDQISITINNVAPTVTITSPADASTFTEGQTIDFVGTASDPGDGDLTASLSWTSSIDGTIGSGGSFSRNDLSAGTHTITASVTDSGSLQGTDQITLTINANTAPTVTITSPADASSFNQGDTVNFAGTASDTEDGDLTASLSWTSDIDGTIGSGGSFSRNDLSPGSHTITASVTDSGSLQGTDQITLTINGPPSVTITSPADASSFNQGDTVNFAGTASDTEDGDLTASLSWTSSIDGTIGSGGSFSRNDLSAGTHTITASVTDSGGLQGTDQISITINLVVNDVTPNPPTAIIDGCNQITVTVTFTGDANNNSTTLFERSPNGVDSWAPVTSCGAGNDGVVTGASPRACVDTTVADNSTNYYRVDFTDGDGVKGTDPSDAIGPYDTSPFCGVDGTTIGVATAEASSCNQITVIARFTGDDNADGSIKVEHSPAGQATWTTACAATSGPSPRQCIIPGLDPSTSYDLQITFTDPDGVAPDSNLTANTELITPTPSTVSTTACGTDLTAPTLLVLAPSRNAIVGGTDRAKFQVYDAGLDTTPLTSVEWSVDSDNDGDLTAASLNSNYDCGTDCEIYEFDLVTTALAQGSHYLTIKAVDAEGNIARLSWGFRVNNSGSKAAGDGFLLRRSHGSQMCIDCHNIKTHSSQSTSSDYGNWAVSCVACHTPHLTKNIYLIDDTVSTPNSGDRPVRFETKTGAVADSSVAGSASYVNEDNATQSDGICQTCHTRTSDNSGTVARWRNGDSGGNADSHYGSGATSQCTGCHTHDAGFSGAGGACNTCHFAPPTVGKHGSHDEVGTLPTAYDNLTGTTTPTQYGFACAKCHSGSHFSDPSKPHTVEVVFDDTADPKNAGGSYAPDGPSQATDPGVNGDGWYWSDGTCSNLYCHSTATPIGAGATNSFASVTWDQDTGATPVTCVSCHDTQGRTDSSQTDDLSTAHGTHIQSTPGETGSYAFTCDECHAQTIKESPADPWNLTSADFSTTAGQGKVQHVDGGKDVFFSATATAGGVDQSAGSYEGDPNYTCSGTYCHSQGTSTASFAAPNDTTLSWNGGTSTCRSCHSGDATTTPSMDSGKHENHVNNASKIGTDYECATCHDATVSSGDNETITTIANHVNGAKNISGTLVDATYASPTCTTSYCHSSGQAPSPPSSTSFEHYETPDWFTATADALDCTGCHGRHTENAFTSVAGEPNYTNDGAGAADANSHGNHVTSAADCTNCHNSTTSDGTSILASAPHTDQTRDVVIASGWDTNGGDGADNYNSGTKTCGGVKCHGTGTPQWGATLVCLDCHNGPDGGTLGDGTPNGVGDEWSSDGHGNTSWTISGNSGPLTSAIGGCDYCHQLDAGHTPTVGTNPYRLRFSATDNTLCLQCHATNDNGIQLNSANGSLTLRDGNLDVDTSHFGTKHVAGEGGELCWDCHDPHGVPTNILMVKGLVSKSSDQYGIPGTTVTVEFTDRTTIGPTAGGFVEDTNSPRRGMCQACHDPASGNGDETTDGGPTKYWRSDGTDNPDGPGGNPPATSTHNDAKLCTDCHFHNNDFKGAGGDCLSCHGDASGAPARRAVQNDFGLNSHHVGASVDADGNALYTQPNMGGALTNYDCVVCHAEGKLVPDGQGGWDTDTTGQPHQDGVIDLRNTDSATAYFRYDKDAIDTDITGSGGGVANWMSGNTVWENQTSTALDPFCLSCHDVDGASASFNNGTNEGRGFTGSATNPFADSAITNEYDEQDRVSVVNIRNKVDAYVDAANNPITPIDRENTAGGPRTNDGRPDPTQGIFSRHAIRGGAGSVYGTSQIPSNRWVARASGNTGAWNDTSVMGCADCHTTDGANTTNGNAHGSNTEYLLKNKDGSSATEPSFDVRNADVSQINCYKCHEANWYSRLQKNSEHTDNNSDWAFTAGGDGAANRLTSDGNIYGLPCTTCHGGFGWGSIHGTSDKFDINAGPAQREAYRFMNGASLRYFDPNGWNTATFTCYTLTNAQAGADVWGSCAQHDQGSSGATYDRLAQRDIQY